MDQHEWMAPGAHREEGTAAGDGGEQVDMDAAQCEAFELR